MIFFVFFVPSPSQITFQWFLCENRDSKKVNRTRNKLGKQEKRATIAELNPLK